MHKLRLIDFLLALLLLVIFALIGYRIDRHETAPLLITYSLAFATYIAIIRKGDNLDRHGILYWLTASVLFRFVLLFAIPVLSDDIYRFIWDGRVVAAGANPFAQIPSYYMEPGNALPGLNEHLFEKLNSQHRFSSYPPVCQFVYWVSVKLSPDSIAGTVIAMKSILLLFEVATLWVIAQLLMRLSLPPSSVLIYALNPLVIVEISGNAHFEGIMTFFLLAAINLLISQKKKMFSAASYALSVCTKLIPLLLLPLLIHPLGKRKAVGYWAVVALVSVIMYMPLVNTGVREGYTTSLGYYFQHFEFNASVYYLIRTVGYWFAGFNIIQFAGPLLALVAGVLILKMAFRPWHLQYTDRIDSNFFKGMTWCLLIYLLSVTTLHPWYIITLLAVSIFAGYRYVVAWTGVIFLTYSGYHEGGYTENYLLVALEYTVVILFLLSETRWRRQIRFL